MDTRTVMVGATSVLQPSSHTCPNCGQTNDPTQLKESNYHCSKCGFELAHLDLTQSGTIRAVFGWIYAAGDVVHGRYRIKEGLGKGGFGATYLVEDLQLQGKRRALKEIPAAHFDEYEASLLSQLQHPSIPDIVDRFTDKDMVYLVLQFGGARTLRNERERQGGRIPLSMLLPWMRQLCDVLSYLHSQTPPIVHRDLKPDNILLDENDRIMLIDFGIAKHSIAAERTRLLGRAISHGYSPPEQVMGTGTDARSDIYALGATFYALLTGEPPPPAHERLLAGKSVTPPSQFIPGIPATIEEALLRALSINQDQRQRSVRELGQAFADLERDVTSDPLQSAQTVRVTDSDFQAASGIGLGSVPVQRLEVTANKPGSGLQTPHRRWVASAIGTMALISMMAAGSYWYFQGETETEPEPTVDKQNAEPSPSDTQQAHVPDELSKSPDTSQMQEGVPQTPIAPSQVDVNSGLTTEPEVSPPSSGPSAEDLLKEIRSRNASEETPAFTPPAPVIPPEPRVIPENKAKPPTRIAVQQPIKLKPRPTQSRPPPPPAPPKKPEGSKWEFTPNVDIKRY
jgi:serine/threonine-protein kinase